MYAAQLGPRCRAPTWTCRPGRVPGRPWLIRVLRVWIRKNNNERLGTEERKTKTVASMIEPPQALDSTSVPTILMPMHPRLHGIVATPVNTNNQIFAGGHVCSMRTLSCPGFHQTFVELMTSHQFETRTE